MKRILLSLAFFSALFVPTAESRNQETIQLSLYGQNYTLRSSQVEGTSFGWTQVQTHVAEVLPDRESRRMNQEELLEHLKTRITEAKQGYRDGLNEIAQGIVAAGAGEGEDMLVMEVADYFVVGNFEGVIQNYANGNEELAQKIRQGQIKHNRYLCALYLKKMLQASTSR